MPGLDAALGLAADRAMDPARYAIGGLTPRLAVRPKDRGEVVEALRAAGRDRLSVVPWGAGVALAHEPAPERYDVAIDLTALAAIVEYDPEDLTLTAECGATLTSLRATLAARGQELPLEAAGANATLGGVLAADASGCRRLRFGAPHDRILGARFVLADGTLARSGGKVVKNVAGYALHRLLCGSHGALAVFVEASLKLAPAPETRVALVFDLDPAALADATRWSWLPRLEPSFASIVGPALARSLPARAAGASLTAIVGLEDDAPRVAEQESVVTRGLGAPRARLTGDDVVAVAQALADLEEWAPARLSFSTSANTPAALAPLVGERLLFHAPAGRLHLFPEAGDATRAAAVAAGFALRSARGVPGYAPPAQQSGVLALRARIRASLDPAGTLAPGERWANGTL
jgi:FAD/FMN-containing dehydrogenase